MANEVVKRPAQDIVREGGVFDLSPRSLSEAIQLAELMAKSEMVPPTFRNKPGDVLIAVQYGAEVGLKPLQAMQGIAVINGRPCIWGDAALAVVLNSGLLENYKEMSFEDIKAAGKAVFWAKRFGKAEPIVREFSIEDAQQAHLWLNPKKSPWCEYPYRMLQMRARAFGLRDGFADALKGMSIREEVEDIEPVEAPKVLAIPRRMSERQIIADPSPVPTEAPEPEQAKSEARPSSVGRNAEGAESSQASEPLICEMEGCGKTLQFHPAGSDGKRSWPPFWSCPDYKKGNGHSAQAAA